MREELKAVSKDRLRDRGTSAEFSGLRGGNKMEGLRGAGTILETQGRGSSYDPCLIIERVKRDEF